MTEISITANSQLTNSYTAYIDFDFDLLSSSTVFYMWSEPNQIINWYNHQLPAGSFVRGLCMFDVHTLEQLKNDKKDICFYAYVWREFTNVFKKYCINAQIIYHRLLPYIESIATDNSIYLYFD